MTRSVSTANNVITKMIIIIYDVPIEDIIVHILFHTNINCGYEHLLGEKTVKVTFCKLIRTVYAKAFENAKFHLVLSR